MSSVTPTPAPAKPKMSPFVSGALMQLAGNAAVVASLIGYIHWSSVPARPPVSATEAAAVKAAKTYVATQSAALKTVSDQVRLGVLTTPAEVQTAIAAPYQPVLTALTAAITASTGNPPGKTISDTDTLYRTIASVAEAMGGGW